MKVVIYSKTPLAAAPWELYKALKKYTDIEVALINDTNRYRDGRVFPHHLLFLNNNGECIEHLNSSDIWHIHNYLVPYLILLKRKQKVMAQFHSVPKMGNWNDLMKFADESYTIDQPIHKEIYKLPSLPNIIDPDEYKPIRRRGRIKIAFAPSTRLPIGNLQSKGYYEVKKILNDLARERDVEIVWIERKTYEENLRMKRESHILIDDVVTGNWHRTSLEGLCFGCAVLNRVRKVPFVYSNLNMLKSRLLYLIDYPGNLYDIQERSRLWILQNWHPIEKLKSYVKVYKELLK